MKLNAKSGICILAATGMALTTAGAANAAGRDNVLQPGQKTITIQAAGVSGHAVVNADGTIARKLNAKTVEHTPGSGVYIVNFNSNVRGCAYNATVGLGGSSGTSAPGFASVVGAAVSVKSVYVTTADKDGVTAERGFHLLVSC